MYEVMVFLVAGMLAAATPILLTAIGALVSERAGVLNLSLEVSLLNIPSF